MMRAYKLKDAARAAKKAGLTDDDILETLSRIDAGLADAELGRFLYKHRIGRRGSHRTIVFYRAGDKIVVLHIFAKARQANLTPAELAIFREVAALFAEVTDEDVKKLVGLGEWIEIEHEQSG